MIVDAGRLERAARLTVTRIGYRQYEVSSDRGPNYVDMTESDPCHCEDMTLRSVARGSIKEMPCKHLLAALIFERNPYILRELDKLNHPEEVE